MARTFGTGAAFRLIAEEEGIGHVEEALMLALFVVFAAVAYAALGDGVSSLFGATSQLLCDGPGPNANAMFHASQNAAFHGCK